MLLSTPRQPSLKKVTHRSCCLSPHVCCSVTAMKRKLAEAHLLKKRKRGGSEPESGGEEAEHLEFPPGAHRFSVSHFLTEKTLT